MHRAKHSTMSKGKSLFGRIFILSVLCHVCLSFAVANARFVDGHYVINDEEMMAKRSLDYVDREKRYTDTQERASAFCTGLCMFEEKKPYSYCFDLCNWNGKGPSPWDHHDRTKDSEASKAMAFPLNRSVGGALPEGMLETQKNIIRTGYRMRPADRNKGRNRFVQEN